jgi:16S rRNA (cytosine1402-N4)-methyltransferase
MSLSRTYHDPVLAVKVVELLVTDPDGVYVDCTAGGGGHSRLIADRISEKGCLIACDIDPDAISEAQSVLPSATFFLQTSFSELKPKVSQIAADGITGAIADLGVSSFQLDNAGRGFSHRYDDPLDLRMNQNVGETAAELLMRLSLDDLTRTIRTYGEDPQARRIAKAIIAERERGSIATTGQLAKVIENAVPATRNKSLARVFQALRIAVNNELDELHSLLPDIWSLLKPQGRLAVISYHSLEDRITKSFMKSKAAPEYDPRMGPLLETPDPEGRLVTRKPITPDPDELRENPRSRSAKLRVIERL